MEYLLCAHSLCYEDIGIHQAWQLFPEGLQCQENKTHVCVNKCVAAGGLRNLSSVTRKFMTSPDDRGKALVPGMFSLGWEDLESSLGEEKAAVVFDVDLEG